jgi:tRNA threonylcarbamoyladenosine biosynthesis protein TsaE
MNTGSTLVCVTRAPEETEQIGFALGAACRGGELVVLVGELGTGKTCLVRGLARGLGCDPHQVRSPSYTLLQRHSGRLELNHYDVYLTEHAADLERNLLAEYLEAGQVVAVEWGDRFLEFLPGDRLEVELQHRGISSRRISLRARGQRATALWSRARTALPLEFREDPPSGPDTG